jgi:hypothetical protein
MARLKDLHQARKSVPTGLRGFVTAVLATVFGGVILVAVLAPMRQAWITLQGAFCPTPTPNWALRQDSREVVDRFQSRQREAVESGALASLNTLFCDDAGYASYEQVTTRLVDEGYCPRTSEVLQYTPSSDGRTVEIFTSEVWVKPCPPDEPSVERGYNRRLVVEKRGSQGCIRASTMDLLIP